MRLEFDEKNPPPGGFSFWFEDPPPRKTNPISSRNLPLFRALHLETTQKGNTLEGGGGFLWTNWWWIETRIGDENVWHTATHSSKELQADNTTSTNKRSSRTGLKRRREESLLLVVYLQLLLTINQNRGRCFSSIVESRCFPLLVFYWYGLLPDSLIRLPIHEETRLEIMEIYPLWKSEMMEIWNNGNLKWWKPEIMESLFQVSSPRLQCVVMCCSVSHVFISRFPVFQISIISSLVS